MAVVVSAYPLTEAWIADVLATATTATTTPVMFVVGPSVLRAPVAQVRAPVAPAVAEPGIDRLGELVDMVWVSADDADDAIPEVRLQFKTDAWGGVRLTLRREAHGLVGRILVDDVAQRREMEPHADALRDHLQARGMKVVAVTVVVST
jgi:hypothetical protein